MTRRKRGAGPGAGARAGAGEGSEGQAALLIRPSSRTFRRGLQSGGVAGNWSVRRRGGRGCIAGIGWKRRGTRRGAKRDGRTRGKGMRVLSSPLTRRSPSAHHHDRGGEVVGHHLGVPLTPPPHPPQPHRPHPSTVPPPPGSGPAPPSPKLFLTAAISFAAAPSSLPPTPPPKSIRAPSCKKLAGSARAEPHAWCAGRAGERVVRGAGWH